MSVVKIIELVGSSNENWKGVTENAVLEASKTVRNIAGMGIVGYTAKVNKRQDIPIETMSRWRSLLKTTSLKEVSFVRDRCFDYTLYLLQAHVWMLLIA